MYHSLCFGFQKPKAGTDSIAYYLEKNNSIKAINFSRKKTDLFLENKKYDDYCKGTLEKSELYEQFNDKENALKVLFDALKIADRYKLNENEILIYRKISDLNCQMLQYTKAKKYLSKAEKKALILNNKELLGKVYRTYFKIYSQIKSDSTKYYLDKIIFYTKNTTNKEDIYKNYSNLSQYYIENNQNVLAKKYLDSAAQLAQKIGDKKFISRSEGNLAYYYLLVEKDTDKAIAVFNKIITLFKDGSDASILGNAYINIASAYSEKGDYKNAYQSIENYVALQDDIVSGELKKSTQEIETKYAINKIENEFQEKQAQLDNKQDRNQKILLIFASLFIFAGFIFYFYYQTLLLKQKNKLKDIDNKLQDKIISATLDGQDFERNKISDILHDNVSALLSSVGLHLSAFESGLNKEKIEELKKPKSLLKAAHDKVRDLSHELVPPLLVKFGLNLALKDLCEKNSNSLLAFDYQPKLIKNTRFNNDLELKIYFIISELLNNVIKHSNATKCILNIEKKENQLLITITDNGKGFDVTSISNSNGFGITQIRARLKSMYGSIKIYSRSNNGTSIFIKINL